MTEFANECYEDLANAAKNLTDSFHDVLSRSGEVRAVYRVNSPVFVMCPESDVGTETFTCQTVIVKSLVDIGVDFLDLVKGKNLFLYSVQRIVETLNDRHFEIRFSIADELQTEV